ncbi:MAG: nicotinate (nicotinamide) nucleotide adenylyltransferase [Verrucomicrobia bacterium]|nr:nicotinate (nicotinamide) nucleotide adenylyltransferase [Verrucomicrobiota bacterium]
MKQRIGLFGGSFDPVHLGHLLVAQAAFEEINLSRIFFIPTAQSPFKPESSPVEPKDRLRMLHSALAGQTWCEVDRQEIDRGGISYTIETARSYRNSFPDAELFYLIGADHVAQLPKWREANALAELLQFIVVPRPGEPGVELPSPFRGNFLRGFPLAVSSSTIRARVNARLSIDHLVKREVAEIIRNNGLYL